jgi:putative endonuclease
MFTVCAISSKERSYIYVGLTSNLEKRLHAHNLGYERTTKPYRPFKLLHHEGHTTRIEARQREKYLKSSAGKSFLKTLELKI